MASFCLSVLLLGSALSGTLAQYNYGTSSAATGTATSAAAGASASNIHQVAVGKNGLVFTPDTLKAAPGDTVEFTFSPGGHSVALSTFSNPCQADTTNAIFSGFPPTSEMFVLKINDTKPLWLFCAQVGHCQGGMAMVINPTYVIFPSRTCIPAAN
jgi:plastocyanin